MIINELTELLLMMVVASSPANRAPQHRNTATPQHRNAATPDHNTVFSLLAHAGREQ